MFERSARAGRASGTARDRTLAAQQPLDGVAGASHAARVVSLTSIGALAWLLAGLFAPSVESASIESASIESSSTESSSTVVGRHQAEPTVAATSDFVVAGPVDAPEAARAHADTNAADGYGPSHGLLPRAHADLEPNTLATRTTHDEAYRAHGRDGTYAPRSSRGPPRV